MSGTGSLQRAVVVRGAVVVLATLGALGGATAGLVHLRARAAVDDALVVAAHAGENPERDEGGPWGLDHAAPPVRVRTLDDPPRDASDRARRREARTHERPVFFMAAGRRGVVVVLERGAEHGEEHLLIEATTRAPGPLDSAGPFLAVYTPLAAAASLVAALGLHLAVRSALAPLARTQRELAAIRGPGSGRRLTEGGPEEIRAVGGAFNELLDRLAAAHQAQERFTAEAAHELRTPVTALRLALDLARRRPRSAEAHRDTLAELSEATDRLQRRVEGLVVLARVTGGAEVAPAVRSVATLVREAAAAEAPDAARTAVGDDRVVVHPELAGIALRNLLRNAARHAPGRPVSVRAVRVGDHVRIEVEDQGAGVAPEDRERLFDAMARGGRARADDPGGLGLGLPLARRIARSEGGDCTLEAAAGGGVRAVLTLPAA